MKQYVVDELRPEDYRKLRDYLDAQFEAAEVGGLYWLPIAPQLLSPEQSAHTGCQPFYAAVDLEATRMACELLVRTKNRVRCACMAYATEEQRNWLVNVVDGMLHELGITT